MLCKINLAIFDVTYEPPRGKTNTVLSQKMARSLKFMIWIVEELYYPCSENKGADQLRGHREADLRLCFRLGRLLVFPCGGSYIFDHLRAILDISLI